MMCYYIKWNTCDVFMIDVVLQQARAKLIMAFFYYSIPIFIFLLLSNFFYLIAIFII